MKEILHAYLKKLTNLTSSNKSLLLPKPQKDQDLDVHELDFLDNKPSFSIIEELLSGKNRIPLCAVLDSRYEKVNLASRKLKDIQRKANFLFEEQGSKELYLGWPFVEGKLSNGSPIRCPLIFFPVTLKAEDNQWSILRREDVSITFNKSFLLAYAHYNLIQLENDFLDYTFDEPNTDFLSFKTALYQLLEKSPLEINFNQELFTDKLMDFTPKSKADLEESLKDGEIKLYPQAVLGIFPQADSYLVPDYEKLIEEDIYQDFEDFFHDHSSTPDPISSKGLGGSYPVGEDNTFTPFRLDASQEKALKIVKSGLSLSIQGPPGTGKSQLISNMVADFMARGKNVLVVCQKKEALKVVHQRLEEKNLGNFSALVYDFKNDRKRLFDQTLKQIRLAEEHAQFEQGLDDKQTNKEFQQISKRIDEITEELEDFRWALFDQKESGFSAKELYLSTNPREDVINLKQEYSYFNRDGISAFLPRLENILPYIHQFENKPHPWKGRKSFKGHSLLDLKSIEDLLDYIPKFKQDFTERMESILGSPISIEDSQWILDRKETLLRWTSMLKTPRVFEYYNHLLERKANPDKEDWLLEKEQRILETFENIEDQMDTEALGQFQKTFSDFRQKRNKPLAKLWWRIRNRGKYTNIQRTILKHGLTWNRQGFRELEEKLDNRMNLEHHLTELKEQRWLTNIPTEISKNLLQTWFRDQCTAFSAFKIGLELRAFIKYLPVSKGDLDLLSRKLREVLELSEEVRDEIAMWRQYLNEGQIKHLIVDSSGIPALQETLARDFDSLCEYDLQKEALSEIERTVLDKLLGHNQNGDFDTLKSLFLNSVKLAWLDHTELKYPILRSVSSLKMKQTEQELQDAIERKRQLSKDILLQKTRNLLISGNGATPSQKVAQYKELEHQVTKRRKVWPIRRLMNDYHAELFKLLPCWLATPETVSAIFPLEPCFDLVIFDEASQCHVEKGFPAMVRGKQVVITGDRNQLSPQGLYQVRYEEEEEHPDVEVESVLDIASKYLPEIYLQGHYRSRKPELIAFSNTHFYEGKLHILPYQKDLEDTTPAISYAKVDGIWENNANRKEAEKVVELVVDLLDKGQENIGVITFNHVQQTLIMDLLEETALQEGFSLPDKLFIKNIENVQGDERDIIIFSIGYAPDESGKMRMHFGNLNYDKGENRLNVAITRAKEKIHIVSSILPHQLKVSDSKHQGPKLLKKYLQFAFDISEGKHAPSTTGKKEFSANWYLNSQLTEALEEHNISPNRELPFADLALGNLLINTDDESYFHSISAKEAHAYTPMERREKGWEHLSIYSRQFWKDPKEVIQSLK